MPIPLLPPSFLKAFFPFVCYLSTTVLWVGDQDGLVVDCCKLSGFSLRAFLVWRDTQRIWPENKASVHKQLMSRVENIPEQVFRMRIRTLSSSSSKGPVWMQHWEKAASSSALHIMTLTLSPVRRCLLDANPGCGAQIQPSVWEGCSLWDDPAPQTSATWMLMRAPSDMHKLND